MNRIEPRADARANRERVICAARELFGERGTTAEMRDIAERAGVAVGTIYRNYPTKGDLLRAVLEDALDEATREADAAEALSDPLAAIETLVEQSIVRAQRFGWLAEAFLSGQFRELEQETERLHSYKFQLVGRFDRLVRTAIRDGLVRADAEPEITAVLLAASTPAWILSPLLESRTPRQIAAAIVRAVLHP